MGDFISCNLCDAPADFSSATDVAKVRSNVRRFRDERFTVWRCRSCCSLHALEDVDLEHYYNHYPYRSQQLDFWARCGYASYLDRLKLCGLRPDHAILDYGCGSALLTAFLTERGYAHCAAYDRHVPRFSDASILSRKFDCIIAQDVIEHVPDPRETVRQFCNHLSAGGLLCIGTPNAARISLQESESYIHSLHLPYHRHISSQQALITIARQCGLTLIKGWHRYYHDTLFPTANYRFLLSYLSAAGNDLDAAFEPPAIRKLFTSWRLPFFSLFGYFFPPRSEMMLIFRYRSPSHGGT